MISVAKLCGSSLALCLGNGCLTWRTTVLATLNDSIHHRNLVQLIARHMRGSVSIKPLSVNEAWKGRRFKTFDYKRFERDSLFVLPAGKVSSGQLSVELTFYFSNSAQDIDGPVKLCLDILQKKYGFNDKEVYELNVKKYIVPKGMERWCFDIKQAQ